MAPGEAAREDVGDALEDTGIVAVTDAEWDEAIVAVEPAWAGARVAVGGAEVAVEVTVAVEVAVATQARAGKSTTASLTRALQSARIVRAATAILVSDPSRLAPARMKVWVRSGYACLPSSGMTIPSICKAPTSAVRQCKTNWVGVKL